MLEADSHRRALACLDGFLSNHAEKEIKDPVKRAILQRDLWALFDWSASSWSVSATGNQQNRRELQFRLAEVLRRLRLASDQIEHLPDTYAAAIAAKRFATQYDLANPTRPFLPPDLFEAGGPWVGVSARSFDEPTAILHAETFSGRSRFLVFLHLPGGRKATFDYLHRLYTSRQPMMTEGERFSELNLQVPQIPVGTEVALVRQMNLFDDKGELVATPITESVQIRVYHSISAGSPYMNYINGPASHDQDFFEFHLDKRRLLADPAGAHIAAAPGDTEYSTFMSHGLDMEGPRVILKSCLSCHADAGIHSIQSRNKLLPPNAEQRDPENGDPTMWESQDTLEWKQNRYDWGLLNGYWQASEHGSQK